MTAHAVTPPTRVDGVALRRRRLNHGLYQKHCASEVGVHSDTWSRWERSGVPMKRLPDALEAIEDAAIRRYGGCQLDAFPETIDGGYAH